MMNVAVIIPSYNVEPTILSCVESCQRSVNHAVATGAISRENIRIILVDDGSTDGTVSLARNKVDEVMCCEHSGRPATMNKAIEAVSANWILWVGADDCLSIDALVHLISAAKEAPDAQLIYGNTQYINADASFGIGEFCPPQYYNRTERLLASLLLGCPFYMGGVLIQKAVYTTYGALDLSLVRSQDHEHFARIANKVAVFGVNHSVYYYRQRPKSARDMAYEWPYLKQVYARVLAQYDLAELFPEIKGKSPGVQAGMGHYLLAMQYMKIAAWDEAEAALHRSLDYVPTSEAKLALDKIKHYRDGILFVDNTAMALEKRWATGALSISDQDAVYWSLDQCGRSADWRQALSQLLDQHKSGIVLLSNTMAHPEFYGLLCADYESVARYQAPIAFHELVQAIEQSGRVCEQAVHTEHDPDPQKRTPYNEADTRFRFGRAAIQVAPQ